MHPATPEATRQKALDTYARLGNKQAAADALGIPVTTLKARLNAAWANDQKATVTRDSALEVQVKMLRAELAGAQRDAFTHESIRQQLVGLKTKVNEFIPPDWVLTPRGPASSPGVPTLFVSDLHWGEVVDKHQINAVNEYNIKIAHQRLQALGASAAHLLKILSPTMNYPGIVVPLGGDMVTGNIHEELARTNEMDIMPTVVDLYGELVALITFLADTFGRVFCPCVTGNHGRDTQRIFAKDRHHTSFDWLLYVFLAKHFEGDERVTFFIPDGPDAYYKIYEHKYLLTHGDQFRGGDGMIGALGPIIRGDHKKRSRNAQIDMDYDTMIIGHWHQLIQLTRLIVNGALKGYDEYAYQNNFPYEPAQQALFMTHWKYRITYRMPVQVDRQPRLPKTAWVSVPKGP